MGYGDSERKWAIPTPPPDNPRRWLVASSKTKSLPHICPLSSVRSLARNHHAKTWRSSWASSKGRGGRDGPAQIQSTIQSQGAHLAASRPVETGANNLTPWPLSSRSSGERGSDLNRGRKPLSKQQVLANTRGPRPNPPAPHAGRPNWLTGWWQRDRTASLR